MVVVVVVSRGGRRWEEVGGWMLRASRMVGGEVAVGTSEEIQKERGQPRRTTRLEVMVKQRTNLSLVWKTGCSSKDPPFLCSPLYTPETTEDSST